ncbi:MAG: Gfo/Idh/MocA family oxidoreductase, partial [Lentisphaeria bacterium]|nr:Gfo/Idh/MocA family oxidoreductase [Lentisphaeria bacterium]
HARIVLDCLAADLPAIHCEKPMALDFGACREMVAAAKRSKTKLTFNHQRRFGAPIRGLRRLIETNVLGEILRMDALCGDLYDGGCHWVDMLTYMNGQHPAEWVMGQVDGREIRYAFGAPSEYQGVYQWKYANGVVAHMETGSDASEWGPSFRITGTEGVAEVPWTPTDGYMLRYSRYDEAGWIKVDCEGEHLHGPGYHERAIADVVDCLQTGRTSELCAENQLMSIEIVFGCYESARRRGRIDLPLDITDNPLLAMIESGQLSPTR